jgi:hypothetical protein
MSDQGMSECLCGRKFSQDNAFGKHQRTCVRTKKRVAGALGKASELFAQKRQKVIHRPSVSMSTTDVPVGQFPIEIEVCAISVFNWIPS